MITPLKHIFVPICFLTISFGAEAATVTGDIDATITLTSACEVNGSTSTSGTNFGALSFGSHSTLFTSATAAVNGNGDGAISIRCSPGSDATLTIVGGLHDDATPAAGRAMSNGSLFVPYALYSDSGYLSLLDNGSTISVPATGNAETVRIYGRAIGATGLVADTYTDTVSVSLDF